MPSLRDEFPALALTVSFAPPRQRQYLADLLHLWLEINRARLAAESIIAATRLTWWRDALETGKDDGVPLASSLVASGCDLAPVIKMLNHIIGMVLEGSDSEKRVCHDVGFMLAIMVNNGHGGEDIAKILLNLRSAMKGEALIPHPFNPAIPTSFKLMGWLAGRPASLDYPDADPLLPLKMILQAWRL